MLRMCPFYDELRKIYIKSFEYKKIKCFKLVKLKSVNSTKELNNLGK